MRKWISEWRVTATWRDEAREGHQTTEATVNARNATKAIDVVLRRFGIARNSIETLQVVER